MSIGVMVIKVSLKRGTGCSFPTGVQTKNVSGQMISEFVLNKKR